MASSALSLATASSNAAMATFLALTNNSSDTPPVGTFEEMKINIWYPKYKELADLMHRRVLEHGTNVLPAPVWDNWHFTSLRLIDSTLETYLKHYLQEQFNTPGKLEHWEKSLECHELLPIEFGGRICILPFRNACHLRGCTMTDGAKIRFSCNSCAHNWTSMKGRITFWCIFSEREILMDLAVPVQAGVTPPQIFKPGANVFFKLYGQDCSQCNAKQIEPKWYQEEIRKVLENFFVQIYCVFYKGLFAWEGKFNHERRVGNPNKPHPSGSCDACRRGICAQSQSR